MSDYGIIATESGVNIDNAPDYRRTIDSRWPTLEVAFSSVISKTIDVNTSNDTKVTVFEHKLGFIPAFTWMDSQGFDAYGVGYACNDAFYSRYNLSADDHNIYIIAGTNFVSSYSTTIRGMLIIYNYNPITEFTAKPFSSSDTKPSKQLYGIASLKDGSIGNIEDNKFKNFSLNSKAKSLNIHKSGTVTSDTSFAIEHKLGYQPSYMIFTMSSDKTSISPGIAARTLGDLNKLSFFGVQAPLIGTYCYMIFKDPILEQAS